ncbi:hypothetical protein HYV30_01005 [Candidatus Kaiserbacteria bacterium]|nr:hypothetical protein [Candidatus Kaiserbacteria bacterium]
MTISYDDFEKVDIRVGKILEAQDFPEARNPAFMLKIDFGKEIGVKVSSVCRDWQQTTVIYEAQKR